MDRIRALIRLPYLLLALLLSSRIGWTAEPPAVIWRAGSSEVRLAEGRVEEFILEGGVVFDDGARRVQADRARYFPERREALLEGGVVINLPAGEIRAESARYILDQSVGESGPAVFAAPPWYGRVERTRILSPDEIQLENGYLTTCDLVDPHYRISLDSARIKPDKWVKMRSATFRVGRVPVFYLPAVSQRLDSGSPFAFYADPAISSRDGFQLLTTVSYRTEAARYDFDLDYRGHKGPGFGFGFEQVQPGRRTEFKTYYIHDLDRHRDGYRGELWHRSAWPRSEGEDTLRLEAHTFSEAGFLKDFFWRESTTDRDRESRLAYAVNRSGYYLGAAVEGELDDFYNRTEYLPVLRLYRPARSLGPGYWQGDLEAAALARDFGGRRRETGRVHLVETLSGFRPLLGGTWRPFASAGATLYSGMTEGSENRVRSLFQSGFNLDWKFGRRYGPEEAEEGWTHYLEPRISVLSRDIGERPGRFYQYDLIDSLDSDQVVSLQLTNRLLAGPSGEGREALRFDLKGDYSLKRGRPGDLYSLINYSPDPAFSFYSEGDCDLDRLAWRSLSSSMVWHRPPFDFGLSHSYQRNESELLTPFVSLPLGRRWRLETRVAFNLKDDGLESREVSLWKDMHCWEGRFGVYHDRKETEVYLLFYPKIFPGRSLKIKSLID